MGQGRPRHPRYLSPAERTTIADLLRERRTVQQIAAEIGRSPSAGKLFSAGGNVKEMADHEGHVRPRRATQRRAYIDGIQQIPRAPAAWRCR